MSERDKGLLLYGAKCMTGTFIVFMISSLLHYADLTWCLISVILVLSPEGTDAVPLALTRIKANLVGAAVGLLCLLISPANVWIISFALTLSIFLCYLFRLDAGARSALAATIIIMLNDGDRHIWNTALERVIAVLVGCIIGLLITFAFHFNARLYHRPSDKNNNKP